MNIQDWFPFGWTGWISLLRKGRFEASPLCKLCIKSQVLTALLIVCYRIRDCQDSRRYKQIPTSPLMFHWLCPCAAPSPPGPAGTRLGGRERGSKPPSDHRPCPAPATPAGKTSAAGSAHRRSEGRRGGAPRRAPVSGRPLSPLLPDSTWA